MKNSNNRNAEYFLQAVIQSSGHFPADFKQGTLADFGDYDGCLNSIPDKYIQNGYRSPHYCLVSLAPDFEKAKLYGVTDEAKEELIPFNFGVEYGQMLKIGICAPVSCESGDIDSSLDAGEFNWLFLSWNFFNEHHILYHRFDRSSLASNLEHTLCEERKFHPKIS